MARKRSSAAQNAAPAQAAAPTRAAEPTRTAAAVDKVHAKTIDTTCLALRCRSTAKASSRSKDKGWTVVSIYDAKTVLALAQQACAASRKVSYTNTDSTPKTVLWVEAIMCVRVPRHTRVLHQGPTYDLTVARGHTTQRMTYEEWCKVFELPADDCVPHIMCMYGIEPKTPSIVTDYIQVIHPEEPWRASGWIKLSDLVASVDGGI